MMEDIKEEENDYEENNESDSENESENSDSNSKEEDSSIKLSNDMLISRFSDKTKPEIKCKKDFRKFSIIPEKRSKKKRYTILFQNPMSLSNEKINYPIDDLRPIPIILSSKKELIYLYITEDERDFKLFQRPAGFRHRPHGIQRLLAIIYIARGRRKGDRLCPGSFLRRR